MLFNFYHTSTARSMFLTSVFEQKNMRRLRVCVSSVGDGAMHMKCPADIGREARFGRTRNRKGLTECRGARDDRASAGGHRAGPNGPAPSKIIVAVVAVVVAVVVVLLLFVVVLLFAVCCLIYAVCCLLLLCFGLLFVV